MKNYIFIGKNENDVMHFDIFCDNSSHRESKTADDQMKGPSKILQWKLTMCGI